MNAYIYRAALYCPPCADGLAVSAGHSRDGRPDAWNDCNSSDHCPQGPYPHGGGEADTPQHCDACGVFLENPPCDCLIASATGQKRRPAPQPVGSGSKGSVA